MLPQLAVFAVTLVALTALNRWITRQVQIIGLRLTGSERAALLGYYLLLLPGIVLHEASHAFVAWLLGMKVSKFSLGPKVRGNSVELGSVQVSDGGTLRNSLVGLAPFVAGTIVLLIVGYRVFDVAALGHAWRANGWIGVLQSADGIWNVPDFWLWAYVIFAASNAMTPSPADREPWLLAGLYLGLAMVVTYLLGGLAVLSEALQPDVAGALQVLTLAFIFTLALNVAVAVALWFIEAVIIQFLGHPG